MNVTCNCCGKSLSLTHHSTIKKLKKCKIYTCPQCTQRIRDRKSLLNLGINWDETFKRFGYTIETMKYRQKVVISCKNCEEPLEIVYRGPSALKKQIGRSTHKTCFRHSKEAKEYCIQASDAYWSDPLSLEIASSIVSGLWRDDEYRQNVIMALSLNDESFISWDYNKHSEHSKNMWSSIDFRNKMVNFLQNEQRQLMIELWADDDYREKMAKTAFWTPQPSKLQRRLIPIFDELNIEFEEEHKIRFYTFDYYLPSINLLIEVQGTYWHSKPEAIIRDKRKSIFVKNNLPDYNLLIIWEKEFENMKEIKRIISSYLS